MVRTLDQWLSYLEQLHPSEIDMGLERVAQVAQRLGLTRPGRKVVTVTGTNGKGSTCAFIASLLRAHGHSVGVYASPHLLRYNERVQVNGQQASDAQLCEAFAAVEQARGEISLTYFEMGTLAAFWLFERADLDVAVLEVGLGGRLDAVNIIDADVAVVTGIALDHSEWLGDTRESVAREKAGIFRSGRPAVCGDIDPPVTLLEHAERLKAPLLRRGQQFDLQIADTGWGWTGQAQDGQGLSFADLLLLDLPMENAAVALQAFVLLEPDWQLGLIAEGLRQTQVTGRLDRRQFTFAGKTLNLLMDVGHNPQASEFLARRLLQRPVQGRRLAVFSLLADKDLDGVIKPLLPAIDHWWVASLPTPRSRDALDLQEQLKALGVAKVEAVPSIAEGLVQAATAANPEDEILLFGSFYCVSEALAWLAQD